MWFKYTYRRVNRRLIDLTILESFYRYISGHDTRMLNEISAGICLQTALGVGINTDFSIIN